MLLVFHGKAKLVFSLIQELCTHTGDMSLGEMLRLQKVQGGRNATIPEG